VGSGSDPVMQPNTQRLGTQYLPLHAAQASKASKQANRQIKANRELWHRTDRASAMPGR